MCWYCLSCLVGVFVLVFRFLCLGFLGVWFVAVGLLGWVGVLVCGVLYGLFDWFAVNSVGPCYLVFGIMSCWLADVMVCVLVVALFVLGFVCIVGGMWLVCCLVICVVLWVMCWLCCGFGDCGCLLWVMWVRSRLLVFGFVFVGLGVL